MEIVVAAVPWVIQAAMSWLSQADPGAEPDMTAIARNTSGISHPMVLDM